MPRIVYLSQYLRPDRNSGFPDSRPSAPSTEPPAAEGLGLIRCVHLGGTNTVSSREEGTSRQVEEKQTGAGQKQNRSKLSGGLAVGSGV